MLGVMLLIAVFLVALNGVFVLIEFALVRVRPSRIEVLARRGSHPAMQVQEILAHLDVYLAAIQMGITIASLALGWIGEPALAALLSRGLVGLPWEIPSEVLHALSFGFALILLSLAHIVLGEVVPRSIGIQKAEIVMLWGAYPLRLFALAFRIPVAFMSWCSVSILRAVGLRAAAESESVVTEEEMRVLLGETQEKGTLPFERLMLLENLFDLGAAKAADAMVPLEKVAVLGLKKSWEENLEIIRSRRYSRYPLSEGGPETAKGFVHVKDILLRKDLAQAPDWPALRREMVEVLDSEPLEKLLKTFPDKGIHMALVRDKGGRALGIVTLEDIVEELIGEVHDEFDLPHAWSLADVVVPAAVDVQMPAAERAAAIRQLLEKLRTAHPEINVEETYKAVWEREVKFSSAVGRGVAVPHARLATLARPLIALGRFQKGIAFPAPDSTPVRLVFLILTPASAPVVQLKILARIAGLAQNENLRRKLLRAKSSEALLDILRTADTLLAA